MTKHFLHNKLKCFTLWLLCLMAFRSYADVTLPKFFSDHMVLQSNENLTIFGKANDGEGVQVSFNGITLKTITNNLGNWSVEFKPLQAGGPYTMTVSGKNTITFSDVYVGDVWFCSGQSNMGWKMENVLNAETEMQNANIPKIKLLNVYRYMNGTPQNDIIKSSWETSTSASVKDFSAVAFLFGKNLYETYKVPIGLINSSWGGTKIEAWMGMEGFEDHPEAMATIEKMKKMDLLQAVADYNRSYKAYSKMLDDTDIGSQQYWQDIRTDYSDWDSFELPTLWKNTELKQTYGVVWVTKEIELTTSNIQSNAQLSIGRVDDEDVTYFNGEQVGASTQKDLDRVYTIDKSLLKKGKNRITIKTKNLRDLGGFRGANKDLFLQTSGKKIPLDVTWSYKVGTPNTEDPPFREHPNEYPTCLYNSMVNPFFKFPIKGVIWYQGESNAKNPDEYAAYFPKMIQDWRKQWGKEVPFLFVQLANYNNQNDRWPYIREAQAKALTLPKTAMVVAIDSGNDANIHPINKQIIGKRLAMEAGNIAYGNKLLPSGGPMVKKIKAKKGVMEIRFNTTLKITGDSNAINGFEVSEDGKTFVSAQAKVKNSNTVVVSSEKITTPNYVRYLWADAPGNAMIYNRYDLPAPPFRTDK